MSHAIVIARRGTQAHSRLVRQAQLATIWRISCVRACQQANL
jgi:hypothetical protein